MASIAGLKDFRQEGPPGDIGVFQATASIIVYSFTFSGTTYIVAQRMGVRGWILVCPPNIDAATVIQASIATLTNGGKIWITTGIYPFDITGKIGSLLSLASNIELEAEKNTVFDISGIPLGTVSLIAIIGTAGVWVENVSVKGLTFDLTDTDNICCFVGDYAKNIMIDKVKLIDERGSGAFIAGFSFGGGLTKYECEDIEINRCRIDWKSGRGQIQPFMMYEVDRARITDCYIKPRDTAAAISGAAIQFRNCRDLFILINVIEHTGHNAIFSLGSSAMGYSSENIFVVGNKAHDFEDDFCDPNNDKNMIVSGNVTIHGSLSLGWVTPEDNCENLVIENNVFSGNGYIIIYDSKKVSIVGNTLEYVDARGYIDIKNSDIVNVGNNEGKVSFIQVSGSSRNISINNNVLDSGNWTVRINDTAKEVYVFGNTFDNFGTPAPGNFKMGRIYSITCSDIYFVHNKKGAVSRMFGITLDAGVNVVTQRIYEEYNYGLEFPSALRRNIALSATFPIDAPGGLQTVTIPHLLAITPGIEDCNLTVVENTSVDDWGYNLLKVDNVGAVNVVAKINVSVASATVGATAKLSLRVGKE